MSDVPAIPVTLQPGHPSNELNLLIDQICYLNIQLQYWQTLPINITNQLKQLNLSINPPLPDMQLLVNINDATDAFASHILFVVNEHIQFNIKTTLHRINSFFPLPNLSDIIQSATTRNIQKYQPHTPPSWIIQWIDESMEFLIARRESMGDM